MPPVPVIRPREVVRAFRRFGWQVALTTLSVAGHEHASRGALPSLIGKAGLSVAEFLKETQLL